MENQNNLFSDLSNLLPHLADIEKKIVTLQKVNKLLDNSTIKIEVIADTNEVVLLNQELIPFNLVMEIRTLIGDSIDEYQRTQKSLNDLANNEF